MRAVVILAALCGGCVSVHEFDALRDRESNLATKADVGALTVRIDTEEKQDYLLASKAEVEVVKASVQNISENVTRNTVGRQEFESISKDVQANKEQIVTLNAGISAVKGVFGASGAVIAAVLAIIGTLVTLGFIKSNRTPRRRRRQWTDQERARRLAAP